MALGQFHPRMIHAQAVESYYENLANESTKVLEAQKAAALQVREAQEAATLQLTKEVAGCVASPPPSSPFSLGSSMDDSYSASEKDYPRREAPGVDSDDASEAFVSQAASPSRSAVSASSDGGVELGGGNSSDGGVELEEDDSSDGGVELEGGEGEGEVEGKAKGKGKGKARK
ncbi:hypothetical protein HBI56_084150 [Parastagonospora nodorum]|uniref:Uncharacterized protein n=2 Tax=Phaeosphaeria nodorum (strain SN15 / ATCC MYA-4574 / FGSC 10173) TaxID=321614 RepID=A0A7U2FG32_PHANO|nr:hypothetical protein SNOG_10469 [Parastagonospora nodorum SN15]KAH3913386.1 hypothetical protein HBH56_102400 [Parastagonospora nodorum]EAT81863.1 hypothetical protein SNOG_10469 [Parastagonospora nodorum SN15]KAH3929367.1 hypothetical protein HBH54_128010 [Parastagonospora nodorum]KAH3951485.1 hypothetical protein HBH53_062020 [Parastagonospora nodorum]KAH3975439.1 hypothetical protein HBH52_124840 [Parastagonospora nodorum]